MLRLWLKKSKWQHVYLIFTDIQTNNMTECDTTFVQQLNKPKVNTE